MLVASSTPDSACWEMGSGGGGRWLSPFLSKAASESGIDAGNPHCSCFSTSPPAKCHCRDFPLTCAYQTSKWLLVLWSDEKIQERCTHSSCRLRVQCRIGQRVWTVAGPWAGCWGQWGRASFAKPRPDFTRRSLLCILTSSFLLLGLDTSKTQCFTANTSKQMNQVFFKTCNYTYGCP